MTRERMSPLTALFLAAGMVGITVVLSGTAVAIIGLTVVNNRLGSVLDLAGDTVLNLPEIIQKLPPAVQDVLNDRRAPEYRSLVDVDVQFTSDSQNGRLYPTLEIHNNGDSVVTMMGVRLSALNSHQVPVQDWSRLVATPIVIDGEWDGPLMPGETRYVVLDAYRGLPAEMKETVRGVVEVSELRVWEPNRKLASLPSAP